jgi:hypothetical protein
LAVANIIQISYALNLPEQIIDAAMGSAELLLCGVDRVITKFDFANQTFSWVSKSTIIDTLGEQVSDDTFVDASLLSGTAFLPTFPPIEDSLRHRPGGSPLKEAMIIMSAMGRSVVAVCTQYQDHKGVQRLDYLDRFKRSRTAIRHGVIFTSDGKVEPLDPEHIPSDLYSIVGQRLPEELYFYLQQGMCSPRVPNWLTSGILHEHAPLDNGESEAYRNLVRKGIAPIRIQALSLLAKPIHRFYQRKDVDVKFWWDPEIKETLSHKDYEPSAAEQTKTWLIRESFITEAKGLTKAKPGTLAFGIACLNHSSLMSKSIVQRSEGIVLSTKDEILSTTIFRFLQLRDYIDRKTHLPTQWGSALASALASLGETADEAQVEAAFLAIELLKLNVLSSEQMFPASYSGSPIRGSEQDKKNTLLVGRLSTLLPIHHKTIGFHGPLSRHLLAYHSMTVVTRNANRDLVEMVLINLFLSGLVSREDRTDYADFGIELPFLLQPSAALGIAVKSYLDELALSDTPADAEHKDEVKTRAQSTWFPNAVDLRDDLEKAFKFWDAIYGSLARLDKSVAGKEEWKQCDSWLQGRR